MNKLTVATSTRARPANGGLSHLDTNLRRLRAVFLFGEENLKAMQRVSESEWPQDHFDPKRIEVWKNSQFLAQAFVEPCGLRVSVNSIVAGKSGRWVDGITWEQLMEIKRQIGRGGEYAIEVLPRDMDIVNVANMRHIWILPEPVCGWQRSQEKAHGHNNSH